MHYQGHQPSDTIFHTQYTSDAANQKKRRCQCERKQTYTIIGPTCIAHVFGPHESQRHLRTTITAAGRSIRRGDERHCQADDNEEIADIVNVSIETVEARVNCQVQVLKGVHIPENIDEMNIHQVYETGGGKNVNGY